jgi:c-di-GMP-binding flagellar brake protein YcgR
MTDPRDPKLPAAPEGATTGKSKRRNPRGSGPFEARRLGALELPLRIHDLSLGGCLIESYQEASVGRPMELEIELPQEGWITLQAEVLYVRENFGYAVKFVSMDEQARVKLARAVVQLLRERKKPR